MQRSKTSSPAARSVKRRLADGTIKTYTYSAKTAPKVGRYAGDSVGALILAYKRSPEWRGLAESTRRTYDTYIRDFERLAHVPVRELSRRVILTVRDAVAERSGNGAGTGFQRAASAVLSWAVDREWIDHSPATRLRPLPHGSLTAWTPAQAATALEHLSEPLRRVVVLALYTGQRRGDLIALPWSAYDGLTIRLRQQKTGAALVVPVHSVLRAELELWKNDGDAGPILTTAHGRPWQAQHVSHMLPSALAKIPDWPAHLNVHGLRKLAAANLAAAGCSTHEIAAITGHRTLGMVQLYTRTVDQERLAEAAMARLETQNAKDAKGRRKPLI